MDQPATIGFIFARGGSKGLPGKNIRPLAGKPLIAHAIECGQSSRWVQRVVVSTDDEEIAAVARQWGAETPFMRPPELARDDSPEWLAWRHAINEVGKLAAYPPLEIFAAIPCTAPMRSVADLDACIEKLVNSDADLVLTVALARRNPYFTMVQMDPCGYVNPLPNPSARVFRRQDAPPVYDIVPVAYVTRPDYVLQADHMFAGRVGAVVVPEERGVDIDTELDFRLAEFMMGLKPGA